MDHGAFVEWEFNSTDEGQHAPEGLLSLLSVTLKRLLEGKEESHTFEGRIQNDWHGIKVEIEGLKPLPPESFNGCLPVAHTAPCGTPFCAN